VAVPIARENMSQILVGDGRDAETTKDLCLAILVMLQNAVRNILIDLERYKSLLKTGI